MTREDDFIGQLEGYLDEFEGATPLPDAVRNAVRAVLPTTKQLGRFSGPMRRIRFVNNSIVRFGLVAVAIVLVVIAGIKYLSGPNVGSEPSPHASEAPIEVFIDSNQTPGRVYLFGGGLAYEWYGLDVIATVPAGWTRGDELRGEFGIVRVGGRAKLLFWQVDTLVADPCSSGYGADASVGPTVDELATALAAIPELEATTPADITLDHWIGKRMDLSSRGTCEWVELWRWQHAPSNDETFGQGIGRGETHEVWMLDIDGQRLVIDASYPADQVELQSELRQIVDSLDIEPHG